ncbi:hypothetical protein LTR33_002704 [Friedmanniomyces endolithicus]|nr:hypothetical protein LTR33_002704 [Friedmanniomyces endolithicus]
MLAQRRDGAPGGDGYGGYPGGAAPQDYAQASYQQGPQAPAGFMAEGGSAMPTAYEQGYEAPYEQVPLQQPGQYQQGYQDPNRSHGDQHSHDERYAQGQNYQQGGGYGRY